MTNYILYIKDITCKINLQIIIDSTFTLRDLKDEICKKLDNDMYPCLFRLVHKGQSLEYNLDIHLEESEIESEDTLNIMFVLNPEKEILLEIKRKMNIQLNWNRNLHLREWELIEIEENLESKYKVTKIYLEYLQLTGEIPKELGKLINLRFLSLNNNQLAGEIPKEIGKLTNLKWLYLHNNQLTGEIPKEIGKLINLQWLYLNNNQLTGEIPKEIGKFTNLQSLCLDNNQLLGEIPKEIQQMKYYNYFKIKN